MKKTALSLLLLAAAAAQAAPAPSATSATDASCVRLSSEQLLDKIKGGWAGQTIGVVYGAPVEFKFTGSYTQAYQPIPWNEHIVKYWWDKKPGLFDDIYNDCTFVETFEQLGLDVSQEELGKHFAYADYHLAHANQAGRYNIRNGIMPPESGNWLNNPHADDLDFQIEADFIGLMAPAMQQQALDIADKVGHIMNSGDGFYGGAFVAGLYSTAFYLDNPRDIVLAALAPIPAESKLYQTVNDVVKFYDIHPTDWIACWEFLQRKWNNDVGCPKGAFLSFNIDARLNSAFVALAMLYGNGDFTETVDIAARCGQDADCNPSTAAGVLGVMMGYDKIPPFWLNPLKEIEDLDFDGTTISLTDAYAMSYKQACELITRNGGKAPKAGEAGEVAIPLQQVKTLPLEQNFTNTYPLTRERKDEFFDKEYEFSFDGNGFVIWGNICCLKHINKDYIARVSTRHIGSEVFGLAEPNDNYVADIQVWIDGKLDQTVKMPMKNTSRRVEPAWKYLLPEGRHTVRLVWLNPNKNYTIRINDIMYYSENPTHPRFYSNKP